MVKSREYFEELAKEYIATGMVIPKKVAHLLLGKVKNIVVTKVSNRTIRLFEKKYPEHIGMLYKDMPVVLDKEHIQHLDNSGHLRGTPSNPKRKKDHNPLTAKDFSNIPRIIHDPENITLLGMGHFGRKIKFERTINNTTTIVVELIKRKNELLITTIYNHKKGATRKLNLIRNQHAQSEVASDNIITHKIQNHPKTKLK